MKLLNNSEMVSFPYSSVADTLQRVIFFKTAIASNKDSILLFEEPEAHCFPPYIKHIAEEIIASESNQFFIATHSPFILDTFLENARTELAIYMADFKNGQTVIKRLTDNEVEDVFNYGLDLFFNAELFTDEI
jgi:predicted ATPase